MRPRFQKIPLNTGRHPLCARLPPAGYPPRACASCPQYGHIRGRYTLHSGFLSFRRPSGRLRSGAAPARRSEALTGAPVRRSTPSTTATRSSVVICAPIRRISLICLKRDSKIVSVIMLVPLAVERSTVAGCCRSVGNPDRASC